MRGEIPAQKTDKDMKAHNYDIKANSLFGGVGYLRELGYAGEFSDEAYSILETEDGEDEDEEEYEFLWSDLMVTDNGTIYAVASDSEPTQYGDFYFKEVEFCNLTESAKKAVVNLQL